MKTQNLREQRGRERRWVTGAACLGGHELLDQVTLFCGSDPHGELAEALLPAVHPNSCRGLLEINVGW